MRLFMTMSILGLLGFCLAGCAGSSDPVAASAGQYTVAPEARLSPEELTRVEAERQKKQEEADRAARKR